VDEIKDLHKSIVDYWKNKLVSDLTLSDLKDSTYLMPEGITQEQLNNSREECVNVCLEQGWKFTDRLHITIWGDKRGV
jgi:organic radical activating enzyme